MARREKSRLSHLTREGSPRMVDVSAKAATDREAVARGSIRVSKAAMKLVREGRTKKGNVVETARLAGILAAKRTSDLVPLCHPLALDHIDVAISESEQGFDIEARVRSRGPTGVEMEALTAVSVAALTVYDMVKAADKAMVIENIRLIEKRGGRSGQYVRTEWTASGASPAGRKRLRRRREARESGRPPRARSEGSEPCEERGEH
ncbi:MAG: cyclic pyranopterin monophosphate synthase MoaC [Vicinamibacteria bacterium]